MFDTYIVKEGDTIFMEYFQKNIKGVLNFIKKYKT